MIRCNVLILLLTLSSVAIAQVDRPRRGNNRESFRERMYQRQNAEAESQRERMNRDGMQARLGVTLDRLDKNGDGELNLDEFRVLGETIPRLQAENVSGAIFSSLDANNDGAVDATEYSKIRNQGIRASRNDQPHDPVAKEVARNPLRSVLPNADSVEARDALSRTQVAFFEQKIEPVLTSKCYQCHSEEAGNVRGGLRLDSYSDLRRGGSSGSILGDDPADSLIVMALREDGFPLMPPKHPLPESTIRDFEEWITMGAPDPREVESTRTVEPAPESTIDVEEGREHWAFQPLRETPIPHVAGDQWSKTTIDRFVYAAMDERGIRPVEDAAREKLIRRAYLDLTGLPPTPVHVREFLDDPADDDTAFVRVVDQLLDSEHFGEHWGRHWLDVARFAESSGKEVNLFYPFAWRYRDYVIDSFNEDKPYDEFLAEQIAGDLLPATDENDEAEKRIATGYLAIGTKSHIETDQRQFLLDVVDEQIDAISRGMLGLTIACARCHDHKFEPISQRDYYAFAGIFASTEALFGGAKTVQTNRVSGLYELPPSANVTMGESLTERERQAIERQLQLLGNAPKTGTAQVASRVISAAAKAKLSHYEEDGRQRKLVMCARDGESIDLPVLLRGEMERPSGIVSRGFPEVLVSPESQDKHAYEITYGSGRLELAEWITDPNHPLTSRVMVNRIWQHLLGRGIVASVDNFGRTGDSPSHAELLDHLARVFVEDDWSVKSLIRRVVTSRVYRLDTVGNAANESRDVERIYLWRQENRRLPAESVRDSILVASGQLDRKPPSGSAVTKLGDGQVRVLDRNNGRAGASGDGMMSRYSSRNRRGPLATQSTTTLEPKPNARSVYTAVLRDRPDSMLSAFNFPDASLVTGQRETTIVAGQALFFMNDPFVMQNADAMAMEILKENQQVDDRIESAFLRTLSRYPSDSELEMSRQFVSTGARGAWSGLCQSLMSTAEFRQTP